MPKQVKGRQSPSRCLGNLLFSTSVSDSWTTPTDQTLPPPKKKIGSPWAVHERHKIALTMNLAPVHDQI